MFFFRFWIGFFWKVQVYILLKLPVASIPQPSKKNMVFLSPNWAGAPQRGCFPWTLQVSMFLPQQKVITMFTYVCYKTYLSHWFFSWQLTYISFIYIYISNHIFIILYSYISGQICLHFNSEYWRHFGRLTLKPTANRGLGGPCSFCRTFIDLSWKLKRNATFQYKQTTYIYSNCIFTLSLKRYHGTRRSSSKNEFMKFPKPSFLGLQVRFLGEAHMIFAWDLRIDPRS